MRVIFHHLFCSNLLLLYFYALPPDFLLVARNPAGKLNGAEPNGSSVMSGVLVVVTGGVGNLVVVLEDGVFTEVTPVIPNE